MNLQTTNAAKMSISFFAEVENTIGKGENAGYQHFLLSSQFFPKPSLLGVIKSRDCELHGMLTITRRQILECSIECSKLKEFADNNFKFDEIGRKLSKQVENTVGKGEIAHYEQFLLFPQCFQKACFPGGVKRCHCVGMG